MKILEQGNYTLATHEVRCGNRDCNAKLEITAFHLQPANCEYGHDIVQYVCPCCNRINHISQHMLPNEVVKDIRF